MTVDSGARQSKPRARTLAWSAALLLLLASCASPDKTEDPSEPAAPTAPGTAPTQEIPNAAPGLSPEYVTARTDVCFLFNGDRITGDIKELDKGLLRFKTDRMDTIYIEWHVIAELTTGNRFRYDLEDGTYHVGSLAQPMAPGMLRIVGERIVDVKMSDVVEIQPSRKSFWDRLDGKISMGIDFTRSTSIAKFDFHVEAEHKTSKDLWTSDFTSTATGQNNANTFVMNDFALDYRYFLEHHWFVGSGVGLFTNEEQGIDLRSSLAVTAGNALVKSNRTWFLLAAGLSGNREFVAGEEEDTTNLEGVISVQHRLFWYDHPEMDMTNDVTVYPSLSSMGRIRATINSRWRWELSNDLYWEFRYWANYDSDPPSEGALNTDFGITTSLGYSW